jgi:hypothetical protein
LCFEKDEEQRASASELLECAFLSQQAAEERNSTKDEMRTLKSQLDGVFLAGVTASSNASNVDAAKQV